MAIPDYQSFMLPVLSFFGNGDIFHISECRDALAKQFGITEEERTRMLPSGKQSIFDNRVGWAVTYLKKAGLLQAPKRGYAQITIAGETLLKSAPEQIRTKDLKEYESFVKFQQKTNKPTGRETESPRNEQHETPEELLESGYEDLRSNLTQEILSTLATCSPTFFERVVVDLVVRMGYGGSRKEAGKAVGQSGDEGVDGTINEDRLGLDVIYLQAKRWKDSVGRPEIQKFAGALQGKQAKKGIFITTSGFTKEARDFVRIIDSKIILIDGEQLAEYMIDHGVGVTTEAVYEVKRIDFDYFSEE